MSDEAKHELPSIPGDQQKAPNRTQHERHPFLCDRCGAEMYESNCKIICPNCGNRFDCSDLNLYFS